MGDFIKTQSSFARGEVAPEFFTRDDIGGLSRLQNMDVLSGGGLSRRRGLTHVATLNAAARLIAFSVADGDDYMLALSNGHIWVYNHLGTCVQDILSPWPADALPRLQYAQRFGTMIFVHPDYQPYVLQKQGDLFDLSLFGFERNDSDMSLYMPFMRFDDALDVKITLSANSGGTNFATFTASRNFWTAANVGGLIYILGQQWLVNQYISPTVVVAVANSPFTLPSAPISDWTEAAFSPRRGWPCSITFHQDRLVFGGSREWPSGVWMSQVGRHHNFNVGTGLDDEAIFITLLSQQRQQICTVVSSDNLQILTSAGEWAISSKPLTPSCVDIRQHTSVGSVASRYLPPQKIEGATVFISRGQKDIRELTLDQLGEHYNANDLCALSKHLMCGPVDMAYNDASRQLFVVMSDGDMAVLNQNSALGISAWGRYQTAGRFESVAVMGGETYVVVQRDNAVLLERFSDDAMLDAGEYGFSFCAAAMPLRGSGHNASRVRVRKITARVLNTKSVFINGMRALLPNDVQDATSAGFCGDVSVSQLGTETDGMAPPWTVTGNDPLPASVLSITMYGRYLI